MKLELIIQDSESKKIYDVSDIIVGSINWTTVISGHAGKLEFSYLKQDDISFSEGSRVILKINDKGIFYGYVFKKSITKDEKINIVAYDQLRFLKNKDTFVFKNMTMTQVFNKICTEFKLIGKAVHSSSYIVSPQICDNKTLFQMLELFSEQTLFNTGLWYIIRDNNGTLEMLDVSKLKTKLYIGDSSLLTNYNFESSIDNDTYNQVKIIKENKETKKRELFIVKDSNNIKKWGLLQYFEKLDDKANVAQIKSRAENILKIKNRATKKLKINCMGDLSLNVGNGIILGIKDLEKEGLPYNKYFIVTSCTHSFSNDLHTMNLELQVGV